MATSTIKSTGIQGGLITGVSIPANGQAEVQVSLKQTYLGGDKYSAVANVQVYGNPSVYTPVIIRNKAYNEFYIRVKNTTSTASTVDINWMAIGF